MNSRFYCLQALARVNAATFPQMEAICAVFFKRTTAFRCLTKLIDDGYAVRAAHPKRALFAYKATPKAYAAVYGHEGERVTAQREFDLLHSLLCTEAILNLGRYKNVTGFAPEAELTRDDLQHFCYSRKPDAIIQITSGKFSYELAVEVESSLKTNERIDEILDSYEKTFADQLLCRGLILIATRPNIYKCYQDRIAKRSKQFDSKVFLTNDISLKDLNPDVYGQRKTYVELEWNLIRTQFQRDVKYIPLESSSYESNGSVKVQILGSQSQIEI